MAIISLRAVPLQRVRLSLCAISLFFLPLDVSGAGAAPAPVKIPSDSPPSVPDVEPAGYLAGRSIKYASPHAPDNDGPGGAADLAAVKAVQPSPEWLRQQAFEDAGAYGYDQLLTRFSLAAGTHLNVQYYPITAYVLRRMLVDLTGDKRYYGVAVDGYATAVKNKDSRARPYLEDKSIIPCEIDYLHGDSDTQSYPSGHATNGYAAALLLAQVMPDRAPLLIARGIRYGDNRVICGVHHPTDVEEGRRIAEAYFKVLMDDPDFQKDLACAIDERLSVSTQAHPLKPVAPVDWPDHCKAVMAAAGAKIG